MDEGSDKWVLQALDREGKLVSLVSYTREEIDLLRKREQFFCPECRELLIVRAGLRVTPHFAHYKTSNCTLSLQGESEEHEKAKRNIYLWLNSQHIDAELERYLSKLHQRPDIFFSYQQKIFAIEFQYSLTDLISMKKRNEGYITNGIIPIWFIDERLLKRTSRFTFQVNEWSLKLMHQFSPTLPFTLYSYSPNKNKLTIVTDIHLVNRRRAIANFIERKLEQLTFREIFSNERLKKKILFKIWQNEKRKFRLSAYRIYGKELKWRKWLYEKRLYIDYLPSIVYLPTPTQHFFNVPLYYWQSYFVIDFFHPIPIGRRFTTFQVKRFLNRYLYDDHEYPLLPYHKYPFLPYLQLLEKLKYVKKIDEHTFMKIREVKFFDHIEKASNGDDALLRYFMYNHT